MVDPGPHPGRHAAVLRRLPSPPPGTCWPKPRRRPARWPQWLLALRPRFAFAGHGPHAQRQLHGAERHAVPPRTWRVLSRPVRYANDADCPRSQRRPTCQPRRGRGLRRDHRHRMRQRACGGWAAYPGPQRLRRRVRPYAPAPAARRGAARDRLLVRPHQLQRALAERHGFARGRGGRPKRRSRRAITPPRSTPTSTGSPAAWPWWPTSWTRIAFVPSAGNVEHRAALRAGCPGLIAPYVFRCVRDPGGPGRPRRPSPAYAARPGSGRSNEGLLPRLLRTGDEAVRRFELRLAADRRIGSWARWPSHMDCDAFYASVEKRDRPELRDLPVIVGGGKRRGHDSAVAIASHQGRALGHADVQGAEGLSRWCSHRHPARLRQVQVREPPHPGHGPRS